MDVLFFGNACVDHIIPVSAFPCEDSKARTAGPPYRSLGGNAANSAVAFSSLCRSAAVPSKTALLAATADPATDPESAWLLLQLISARVDATPCVRLPTGQLPVSYILLNAENGSRTIMHHRSLPELEWSDACSAMRTLAAAWGGPASPSPLLDPVANSLSGALSCLHVEARNTELAAKTLAACRTMAARPLLTLELEQRRTATPSEDGLAEARLLLPLADVVVVGRDYWTTAGLRSAEAAMEALLLSLPPLALLVLPRGGEGLLASVPCRVAGGLSELGPPARWGRTTLVVPARRLSVEVCDTRGAGDTLVAALIFACLRSDPVRLTLTGAEGEGAAATVADFLGVLSFANLVAGEKCGLRGLDFSGCSPICEAAACFPNPLPNVDSGP